MGKKLPTLDLHGFTTDEVFNAIEAFFKRTHHVSRVRIMPGKGSGKVQRKVEEYLRLGNYHWEFERLPNGGTNQGVMVVFKE